jgi:hypothetical protein
MKSKKLNYGLDAPGFAFCAILHVQIVPFKEQPLKFAPINQL